ncbi:site-specific recombinase XerC [Kribbella sp. VKM Ac-2571]|uniref:tyrosine-type recombinase/integrase n=1 Tax=Kribbella sp. VKM Ac-2571 TaxID=2512222 RepID=UPI0010F2B586|nr:site-specific integrase [Kribbella sp. VKM Ac-2571]TDO67676.1 site-specific recombinase XerC [Kribbella sp. VKM Ac-2571]
MTKRRFGRIRKLPSGRFQARYPGPDGVDRPAPNTFPTKTDASRWLINKEAELLSKRWIDPALAATPLETYARKWIDERPGLRPKTLVLYNGLLRNHIAPTLGEEPLNTLTPPMLRTWRKSLLDGGLGPVTTAKAYRLLRSILTTAVEDRMIEFNPCYIKGAATEKSPERPTLTLAEVYRIASGIAPRYRALVLLAAMGSLRWGELAGLQRRDVSLSRGVVKVRRAAVELPTGELRIGPPKSDAGVRDIHLPELVIEDLRLHFEIYVKPGAESHVFTGPKGALLRRSNFQRAWSKAVTAAELPGTIHFHDLRHTGNNWAAEAGATLADLMQRMGHASTRAAVRYIHTRDSRQRFLAQAMSEHLDGLRDDDGTDQDEDDEGDALPVASGT